MNLKKLFFKDVGGNVLVFNANPYSEKRTALFESLRIALKKGKWRRAVLYGIVYGDGEDGRTLKDFSVYPRDKESFSTPIFLTGGATRKEILSAGETISLLTGSEEKERENYTTRRASKYTFRIVEGVLPVSNLEFGENFPGKNVLLSYMAYTEKLLEEAKKAVEESRKGVYLIAGIRYAEGKLYHIFSYHADGSESSLSVAACEKATEILRSDRKRMERFVGKEER